MRARARRASGRNLAAGAAALRVASPGARHSVARQANLRVWRQRGVPTRAGPPGGARARAGAGHTAPQAARGCAPGRRCCGRAPQRPLLASARSCHRQQEGPAHARNGCGVSVWRRRRGVGTRRGEQRLRPARAHRRARRHCNLLGRLRHCGAVRATEAVCTRRAHGQQLRQPGGGGLGRRGRAGGRLRSMERDGGVVRAPTATGARSFAR